MALEINQINLRPWDKLLLSKLKAGVLKTEGRSLQPRKVWNTAR